MRPENPPHPIGESEVGIVLCVSCAYSGQRGRAVQPTITADRDRLHREARYNYEAHGIGFAWFGANFTPL